MHSSDWKSSAIFLAWDDWGGFYDHVNPLLADILDVLDGSSLTAKDQAASPQTAALSPSELRVLRYLRPSHHSAERGVPAHRLPARTAVGGPLDGSPAPAQERGLDGSGQSRPSAFRSCIRPSMSPPAGDSRTLPELADLLTDDKPLDRTTLNSSEDIDSLRPSARPGTGSSSCVRSAAASRSLASCSATGLAWKLSQRSSRSYSLTACEKSNSRPAAAAIQPGGYAAR